MRWAPCSSSCLSRRDCGSSFSTPTLISCGLARCGTALKNRSRPATGAPPAMSSCAEAKPQRGNGCTSASPIATQTSRRLFCGSIRFVIGRVRRPGRPPRKGFESADSSARDVADRLLHSSDAMQRALGARLRNLGIHRWQIWSSGAADSIRDLVESGGPRVLIVDLGSLATWGEKAIAAESVLAALWRRRGERDPTLVVIDEAHNVCPREPGDEIITLATEHAARIAAEGRKFGLYLLVSTQRPQRVNELVVSQCDNLVLMRTASRGDLAYLTETLSFVPEPLVEYARHVPTR